MSKVDATDREFQHISDHFDHQRWTITCRMMQLRIARNELDGAHAALRNFCQQPWRQLATIKSPIAAVLPRKIANALEEDGYDTLESLLLEDAETLLGVPNIGTTTLALIRDVSRKVLRGEVHEAYFDDELEPDRQLCLLFEKGVFRMSDVSSILQSVEALSSPDTIQQINNEIGRLEAQIEKLKGVRKLLGGGKGLRPMKLTPAHVKIADSMAKALAGSDGMRPGDLAKRVSANHLTVGRIAKSDPRFKSDGKQITLA